MKECADIVVDYYTTIQGANEEMCRYHCRLLYKELMKECADIVVEYYTTIQGANEGMCRYRCRLLYNYTRS